MSTLGPSLAIPLEGKIALSGRWYLADGGSVPGDLLLLIGKALIHATVGLCPTASYIASPDYFLSPNGGGRYQIIFLTKVLYL